MPERQLMRFGYRIKQLILLAGDLGCFYISLFLSISIRSVTFATKADIDHHAALFSGMFCLWLIINYINGLYDLGTLRQKSFLKRFIETGAMALVVSVTFFYLLPNNDVTPKTILLLNITLGYGMSFFWRILYHPVFGSQKRLQTNVILVGYNQEVAELIEILHSRAEKSYAIAALIDPDHAVKSAEYPSIDIYHGLATIRPAITNHQASLVVVAPHLRQNDEAMKELYELLFWKVHITDLSSFYEIITGRIPPSIFSESWFLDHLKNKDQPIYNKIRRAFDIIAAILFGIMFLILGPFISLGIVLTSPGPIFIRQKRVGQYGTIFTMYKFRSMYALSPDGSAETEGVEFATKNDKRITPFGNFLRKTRLDELPQCWNLLRRQVTLIGPRPERPEIVKKLEEQMPYYRLRHCIMPGITGWAAIQQHYTDTMETSLQKLQYDLYYIKNKSILVDLSILLRTINVVIRMMGQ